MYSKFSRIVPVRILRAFRREMDYLGIEIGEKRFVGFIMAYGAALSLGVAINLYYLIGINILIGFLGCFLLFFGGTYLWLSAAAESKGKFVDKVLPDALQLIASNLRAGLTLERSLLVSARDEFGVFGHELKQASKKVLAGASATEALNDISKRIHSPALERAVWLICQGIGAGGQIADLLTQMSEDLRAQLTVNSEIKANISIYVMLILFAAVVGAPVLFGVSTFIAEVLTERMETMPDIGTGGAGFGGGVMSTVSSEGGGDSGGVETRFIIFFSQISLLITTFFASLTIGIINSGSEKSGLKMFPVILIIVFALFFFTRGILAGMFGNLV